MYAAVSAVSDRSCNKHLRAACLFYYIAVAPWNSHRREGARQALDCKNRHPRGVDQCATLSHTYQ